MGLVYWNGWLLWAVLLFFFARRHPPVYDHADLGAGRIQTWRAGAAIFLLCFRSPRSTTER
jgi:hypothetical protein